MKIHIEKEISSMKKDKFLNLKNTCDLLAIGKSTLYRGIKSGIYPPPYRITAARTAWSENELLQVVENIKAQGHCPYYEKQACSQNHPKHGGD